MPQSKDPNSYYARLHKVTSDHTKNRYKQRWHDPYDERFLQSLHEKILVELYKSKEFIEKSFSYV